MIATGGLLRINARRQDSLRSKTHKAHTHRKKNKKKRRSEVVVVKGKLKLFSVSGLVAALGVLVLLVGVVMAALGYWPRDGLIFSRPQGGAAMTAMASSRDREGGVQGGDDVQGDRGGDEGDEGDRGGDEGDRGGDDVQGDRGGDEGDRGGDEGDEGDRGGDDVQGDRGGDEGDRGGDEGDEGDRGGDDVQGDRGGDDVQGDRGGDEGDRGGDEGDRGGDEGDEGDRGGDDGFNRTETTNGTSSQRPRGFLEEFLNRYLYSDRLKVFGPLIMGIGIFLFICANAVLHENRDKKTKVINLRDIYSTVIDLHSLRKPLPPAAAAAAAAANPLNGLVNYVQSKSLEAKPRTYPASLLSRREGGGAAEGGAGPLSRQPLPGSSRGGGGGGDSDEEGGDAVFSIYREQRAPPGFSPALGSFTLPRPRPRPSDPRRRNSARAGTSRVYAPPPLSASTPPPSCSSALLSSSSLSPSHLSLSSLSHLLSPRSSTPAPPCRRRSLPTGGYSKLSHGEDESFEWTEMTSSHPVTSQGEEVTSHRKYSNREKLMMMSQVGGGVQREEDG